MSANGWINTDLFEARFIPSAVSSHPLFLLLDGHSTHYQPQVIKFAMEHQCIILRLPPHTTHKTQPLDVGIFVPLKVQWVRVCHSFYQKNPGKIINKFSEAWYGAVTPVNIIAGFHKAGVCPFNPDAVTISTSPDKSHCPKVRETSSEMTSSHSTGLDTVSASESIDNPVTSISDSCTLQTAVSDPYTHRDSELQTSDASKTTASDQGVVAGPSFSQEQQHRFQVRYEEGFDIAGNPDYVSWLQINHPDSRLLQHPTGPQTSVLLSESVRFSDVTPLQEITVDSSTPNTESDTSKTPSTSALFLHM